MTEGNADQAIFKEVASLAAHEVMDDDEMGDEDIRDALAKAGASDLTNDAVDEVLLMADSVLEDHGDTRRHFAAVSIPVVERAPNSHKVLIGGTRTSVASPSECIRMWVAGKISRSSLVEALAN